MKNLLLYAKDILDNIEKAEVFMKGVSYEKFVKDDEKNYAVIRCIEIIGDAARNLSKAIGPKYPDIPWKEMIRTRDLVSHHYDIVDSYEIWDIVKNELPKLKNQMKALSKDLKK